MAGGKLTAFINRYFVTITMIPTIIRKIQLNLDEITLNRYFHILSVVHYGWWKLQNVDALVKEEERKEFPLLHVNFTVSSIFRKICLNFSFGRFTINGKVRSKWTPISDPSSTSQINQFLAAILSVPRPIENVEKMFLMYHFTL